MTIPSREEIVAACLEALPSEPRRVTGHQHLVAKDGATGYAVVYSWPDVLDLTEEVYEVVSEELAAEGLQDLVVFSRYALVVTDDVEWRQFPRPIMRQLFTSPAEKALQQIALLCRNAQPSDPTTPRLVDVADIERIIADYVPETV